MAPKLSWMRGFWLTLHGDPRVQLLGDGAFRVFARIMAATWMTEQPGVLDEQAARAWGYGGVPVPDDTWDAMKAQLEPLFIVDGPKLWVHRRSADEYDRLQDARERLKSHRDRRKETKGKGKLASERAPSLQETVAGTGGTVETLFGDPAMKTAEPGGCTREEWEQGFDDLFWPAYPRKVVKHAARKAWLKIRPWTQPQFNAIMDGLEAQAPAMRKKVEGGESDFVPHASTWINQRRWEG